MAQAGKTGEAVRAVAGRVVAGAVLRQGRSAGGLLLARKEPWTLARVMFQAFGVGVRGWWDGLHTSAARTRVSCKSALTPSKMAWLSWDSWAATSIV